MKKVILILSAAAAIAACTKNEVIPVSSNENAEITFNVAPKTKADVQPDAFDTNYVFCSWAYYLPAGKIWEANRRDSDVQQYINASTVSYQSTNKVWKNTDNTYYWPKLGSLTFFAYSLNKNNLVLKHDAVTMSHVLCYNDEDAYGINGIIDLDENPNTDFLVAEISKDKRGNDPVYNYNGVPTLFRHKLSRVAFAVKLADKYANSKFTLDSIKFNKLSYAAYYSQFNKDSAGNFVEYSKEIDKRSTQVYTGTSMDITSSTDFLKVPEANEVRYIYVPQTFKDKTADSDIANIEVKYTITATVGDKEVKENCKAVINVKDYFESWDMGKRYTINLTFGLDEILWAPAVEDWDDVAGKGVTIEK